MASLRDPFADIHSCVGFVSLYICFLTLLCSPSLLFLFFIPPTKTPHHEREAKTHLAKAKQGSAQTRVRRAYEREKGVGTQLAQEKREPSHGDGGGDDGRRGARGRRGGGGGGRGYAGGGALGGGVPHRGAPRPRAEGAYLSPPPLFLSVLVLCCLKVRKFLISTGKKFSICLENFTCSFFALYFVFTPHGFVRS